jgi:GH15 family glucan-1,4-alpha-glucosidase
MCWVAFDRAIRLGLKRSLPAPLDRWHQVRDEIFNDIFTHFWNGNLQTFVQCQGTSSLDAASLLMPLVKVISPTDPRWLSTLQAVEPTLLDDTLIHQAGVYRSAGGGEQGGAEARRESTISAGSFWYVECLARAGELNQARLIFEKAMGYANHLGLYAETLGPRGEHLGNFPHALTHLALISAAYDLDRRLSDAGQEG